MTNYNLEELDSFSLQLILTALLIGTLFVSMTLTYNQKLKIKNKTPLYTSEEAKEILILNRTISVLISIGFLFLNLYDRNFKEEGEIKFADLQVDASILSLISGIIVLYVVLNDKSINLENPTL